MSVPCPTCWNQISPYDPRGWAYVEDVPSDGNYDKVWCGVGDAYLGMITNRCTNIPTVPVSARNVKYLSYHSEDCSDGGICLGKEIYGLGECHGDAYGACQNFGSHRWFGRDWAKELPTAEDQLQCCIGTDPTIIGRTQWCPTDLWYGSQKCQTLVSQTSSPLSGVDSYLDKYLTYNLTDAGGMDPTGVFSAVANAWANQASTQPISPTDPWVAMILKYQTSFPQIVGPVLTKACSSTSGSDISADTTGVVGRVCGCYLPSSEYFMDGIVPRECQGLCQLQSSVGGVPIYDYLPGQPYAPRVCKQSTCVFDDVTVDFINSTGANVNFSQVCGQCAANGACTCVMDGVTFESVNSSVPNINLGQNCFSTPNPPTPPSGGLSEWWILLGVGIAVGLGVWWWSTRRPPT